MRYPTMHEFIQGIVKDSLGSPVNLRLTYTVDQPLYLVMTLELGIMTSSNLLDAWRGQP